MAEPVVGPIVWQDYLNNDYHYWTKKRYRQRKPYTFQFPYETVVCIEKSYTNNHTDNVPTMLGGWPTGFNPDLQNKSYSRLQAQICDTSMWAVNLAEYGQSIAMMRSRIQQIARFTNQIRKMNFQGAARTLGINHQPLKVGVRRTMANNWLEYSFGWKPLIQDIYSAIDHLQTPIKSIRPKGSASSTYYRDTLPEPGDLPQYGKRIHMGLEKHRQGCEVTIENPNLYLANALGLANPAIVAWELIPFSFVVDWFVNVGQFLSQGSDFLGLTVTRPWQTCKSSGSGQGIFYSVYNDPGPRTWLSNWKIAYMQRALSLSGVTLKVYSPRLWGWQRCANAAAVLTQSLGSLKSYKLTLNPTYHKGF